MSYIFHAWPKRICNSYFLLVSKKNRSFHSYFPSVWDADGAVEKMYDVLNLLVNACVEAKDILFVGGDFNACSLSWNMAYHGLQILNRQMPMSQIHDSWTCAGSLDGALVQIDFLLANTRVVLLKSWNDFTLPIGPDHRSAHCKVRCISNCSPRK